MVTRAEQSAAAGAECCREVEFPSNCRTSTAMKKHKELVLKSNPEVLFTDFTVQKGKRIKSNLIFHTDCPYKWKSALCQHYDHICKEGIGRGGRLIICEDEKLDTENPELTITYYTKGTILIQGNEKSLNSFETAFPELKAKVQGQLSSAVHECEEQLESSVLLSTTVPQSPLASQRLLREHLGMLELHFEEFKELTQSRLESSHDSIRLLREELQCLREESQTAISRLQHTIQAIQQDNVSLKAQVAKVKEESTMRERTLLREITMMKERLEVGQVPPPDTDRGTQKDVQPVTPSTPGSQRQPQRTDSSPTSQHTTDAQPHTDSSPSHPIPKESLPPQNATTSDPEVVLLMDSNGKFIDPKRLFPGQRVTTNRCSNTNQALRLLSEDNLGRPNCIIIHTGTNDLHSLGHGTAEAMTNVAAKASREFPDSCIIMSTLLPRTDIPPHVIHNVNTEISRRCSSLPNVQVAHHPFIGPRELYDGLHLHKNGVRVFARTLKDVALGRNAANCPPYIARRTHPPVLRHGRSTSTRGYPPQQPFLAPHPVKPVTGPKKPQTAQPQSYAAAVAQPVPHQPTDLGEIKHLLHRLCAGLLDL